ncbi:MAG: hypothetical protein IJ441_08920, partial [Spirochaetaceae bacterium]|nr:hypothetical protein [Spirochaetaceae bacterium]
MLSDIKAVIFDLDGTLYNFKWLPLRLMWSLPTDVLRIKADREVRKKLKGCDLATPEAYLAEYGRLMAEKTDFKS